ncbi:hypothetical protein [Trinickia mobilis]|uniref:hypothetical protein n=1 Tax=Trinickia mobilis TaxID=2816356 RepID=UPI001A8E514B|nr:hypothetical protein [Trinickia mobilis]
MHGHTVEPAQAQARREYYDRIDKQNFTPLWEVLDRLVTPEPASPAAAALWRYAEIREPLMEAGLLISAAEAEGRVLVFVYPHERTRESLLGIAQGEPDRHLGFKLRYVNPATGGSPMPTIGAFAQRLPRGFETRPYRCTDGTVYVCLEGSGQAEINGTVHSFGPNDIFVVPSWNALRFHATTDTHLFSFSDRPVHQALGLWREARE